MSKFFNSISVEEDQYSMLFPYIYKHIDKAKLDCEGKLKANVFRIGTEFHHIFYRKF